jgi:hypothetical protein
MLSGDKPTPPTQADLEWEQFCVANAIEIEDIMAWGQHALRTAAKEVQTAWMAEDIANDLERIGVIAKRLGKRPAKRILETYLADLKHFGDWCKEHGFPPFSKHHEFLAAYLVERSAEGDGPKKLARIVRAVARAYRVRKLATPPDSDLIDAILEASSEEKDN